MPYRMLAKFQKPKSIHLLPMSQFLSLLCKRCPYLAIDLPVNHARTPVLRRNIKPDQTKNEIEPKHIRSGHPSTFPLS